MNEPLTPEKARENQDRMTISSLVRIVITLDEMQKSVGALHERFLGEDSDKVIGEMNHRINKRYHEELRKVEDTNAGFAAWLDDQGRPGDASPPQP